jgi:hypothetical protein
MYVEIEQIAFAVSSWQTCVPLACCLLLYHLGVEEISP